MIKGKILCIDDDPDELIETSHKSLTDTVSDIFEDYEVFFETTGQAGLERVEKDQDIKLILLDIEFAGQEMQGSEIADNLHKINPHLKIIVLTKFEDTGQKRRFGWKPNVVGYIVKKDISDPGNRKLLSNLAEGIIEDPDNRKWEISLDTDLKKVTVSQGKKSYSFSIPRSERKWLLLEACANNPNEWINSYDIEGFTQLEAQYPEYVNKEVYDINKTVIKKTDWRTWGILDTSREAPGSAKLVIGNVKIDKEDTATYKRPAKQFITAVEFEKYKKHVESRLRKLEERINLLKTS